MRHNQAMHRQSPGLLVARAFSCWNWKCALISAGTRSLVYLGAMARGGSHGRMAIVLVELAYVSLTSGIYAGLQQKALGLRSRLAGNLLIVIGVPGLSQCLDWLAHRFAGAPAPPQATLAVCIFAALSALFHLHLMRSGALLTGDCGRSLKDDLRRLPRLAAGFVLKPLVLSPVLAERIERALEDKAAA
jgi:hypothetical protein